MTYVPTVWTTGMTVDAAACNKWETGIKDATDLAEGGIINAYTGRAFTLSDLNKTVSARINTGGASLFTVPAHGTVAAPLGSTIEVPWDGIVQPTFAPATGVALVSESGMRKVAARFRAAALMKCGIPVTVGATKPTVSNGAAGVNPSINLNFGTAAVGDVIVAAFLLTDGGGTPTISTPSGWTSLGSQQAGGSANTQLYVQALTVTSAGTISPTWTTVMSGTNSQVLAGGILIQNGFGYIENTAFANNSGGNTNNIVIPAATGAAAALAVGIAASTNGTSFTAPTGYTEQFDFRSGATDAHRALALFTSPTVAGASAATAVDDLASDVDAVTGVAAAHILVGGGDQWRLDGALSA